MATFDDLKKGTKPRQLKTRAGEIPPAPAPAPEPVAPATLRVRMLRNIIGSRRGSFFFGRVYELPADVAREWIGAGLVEEDKSLDGPPETK